MRGRVNGSASTEEDLAATEEDEDVAVDEDSVSAGGERCVLRFLNDSKLRSESKERGLTPSHLLVPLKYVAAELLQLAAILARLIRALLPMLDIVGKK